MASKNALLPSREQCNSLSDEQCREIQRLRDPNGVRAYKIWELAHQPELIRYYMAMSSFPQIESLMKPRLDWSYKTYANRFRDWLFPVDRYERETAIVELYKLVSKPTDGNTATPSPKVNATLPLRPLLAQDPSQQIPAPTSVPAEYFVPVAPPMKDTGYNNVPDGRLSMSTVRTTGSISSASTEDTWNTRSSVTSTYSHEDNLWSDGASITSSIGSSAYSTTDPFQSLQLHGRARNHDPQQGVWNNSLRVLPCNSNHSFLRWNTNFAPCTVCGFSQWHALMISAGTMDVETFSQAMIQLADFERADRSGNYAAHFLMAAGVGMEYLTQLLPFTERFRQNHFGQNPLHLIDPQGLGEEIFDLLDWFNRKYPPGLQLTQRDIYCRTPLHMFLQQPLERYMYRRLLNITPFAHFQVRCYDTTGRSVIKIMENAAANFKSTSSGDYQKIQDGIQEVQQFISETESQITAPKYGFNDIARGARGTFFGGYMFTCRICNQTYAPPALDPYSSDDHCSPSLAEMYGGSPLPKAHSSSYLEQMKCARDNGRDRNGPDEKGLTPAHALVTLTRHNNGPEDILNGLEGTDESPQQTAELFRILVYEGDPSLLEILHALDPQGNSLTYNVAVGGFVEILKYMLALEEPSRRLVMVNSTGAFPGANRSSVLQGVEWKIQQVQDRLRHAQSFDLSYSETRNEVIRFRAMRTRLLAVKNVLLAEGAVGGPLIEAARNPNDYSPPITPHGRVSQREARGGSRHSPEGIRTTFSTALQMRLDGSFNSSIAIDQMTELTVKPGPCLSQGRSPLLRQLFRRR